MNLGRVLGICLLVPMWACAQALQPPTTGSDQVASAPGLASGDQFVRLPAFSAEVDRAIDVKGLEAKYPEQKAVYIERITDLENETSAGSRDGYVWNLLETEYRKYVVFNAEDQAYSTLTIHVPREYALERVKLSISNPDGSYRSFGMEEMQSVQNSDGSSLYKFAFPGVVKGSVITEAHVLKQLYCLRNSGLNYSIPLQFEIPCEKMGLRIVYPSNWEMRVKRLSGDQTLPMAVTTDKKKGLTVMSYSADEVPPVPHETFAPFYKEVARYADVQITKIYMKADGYYPVNYKAPKDWNELSDRFKQYVVDRDALFSGMVSRKVQELTADCQTDLERLDAIITWLQLNMKHVDYVQNRANGLNGCSFSANLERQEGTVAQITGLALSMLQKAKIESSYVLLHSAKDGYFDPTFISYSQLDMPAILAKIGGQNYVVFPCEWHMPVDFVPEEFQGQKALVIDRKGRCELVEMPMGGLSANETLQACTLTFQEDGRLQVEEEQTIRGYSAYQSRLKLAGLSGLETERLLKHMLAFPDGKTKVKHYTIQNRQDYKEPLRIKVEYELDNLVTLTPDEVVFNTGGLFVPASRVKGQEVAAGRKSGIKIYFDEIYKKNITLRFPSSWVPQTRLEDFKVENRFGAVQGTFRSEPGALNVTQELVLKKVTAPRESFPELQALTDRKARQFLPALVFRARP